MFNNILEISKRSSKGGRVPIKIALLKIHEDANETNKNGIHWDESFIKNAMDSAKMMPICAEFCTDEKDVPLGHGLTNINIDDNGIGEPEFLNSETVGVIESTNIESIEKDGENIKVLAGSGYLYNQRYPNFVKWVRKNYALGTVDTSIELMGLTENNNKIVYLEDNPTDEFRTPKEFMFSGTAILAISPADDSAIVLEVAQKKDKNKEEYNMELNMDELKSMIKSTITEINSKEDELNFEIVELKKEITSKDDQILELNATIEQVQKALDDLQKEHEAYWEEREVLEKELGKLKAEARLSKLNSAIEGFSDAEKKYAESEINSFNENPMDGDVDAIVSKIYAGIGEASKKAEVAKIAEINSMKNKKDDVIDIFSEMHDDTSIDDDVNIF